MRFFIDHCVPTAIGQFLLDRGHTVLLLRDYLPIESPDEIVIAKAQELAAILVSLNGDFADIVSYPPAVYLGIVSIQLRNHPEIIPVLMQGWINYLSSHNDPEYYRGKLFIIEVNRIRV